LLGAEALSKNYRRKSFSCFTPELRAAMGAAAVNAAKSINYDNAGTVVYIH
jgi:acetyl/propionyl-CoA carboxylase alpha subunit